MIHAIKNYLKHSLNSIHLHGIHSPFVFNLQHKCLLDNSFYDDYDEIIRFRESVKTNKQILSIQDHGAGSKKLAVSERAVQDILKVNVSTLNRTKLLYRLCNYLQVNTALELGTSIGITAQALALSDCTVHTVEASAQVAEFARNHLKTFEKVSVFKETFSNYFANLKIQNTILKYDLVFMDGHHDGAATLNYFESLLPYVHNDTCVILDDIYWSPDMTQAWKRLQKHENVTASIDTFYWGFLFFRKEQKQQTFYLKL